MAQHSVKDDSSVQATRKSNARQGFQVISYVVGELKNKHVACVPSKDDNTKSHIRFQLTDGRSTVYVTFFNELAQEFEKRLQQIEESNIYVIISSAKVNEYEGLPSLNNYPATRFFLNIDHYSVKQLKARMLEIPNSDKLEEVVAEPISPMLSIADIKQLSHEYAKRKIRCQITVKKVDVNTNWYDNVCTTCGDEVQLQEGRFRCEKCVRNIPFPDKRFRLATICNDETGVLAILLPDDEIQRILGKNAFDIEYDENEVSAEITFPPSLKSFEKKQFVVTLLITDQNVKKTCSVYNAIELNDPVEVLGNHSPLKKQDITSDPISETMVVDRTPDTSSSPPTGKSTTKVRSRTTDGEASDSMYENVPLAKFKIVKTEKK
nr:PREDICTED: replication protein A 70 kDa DNA-binding subunit D-like [Daucus carota subsp. sativus]